MQFIREAIKAVIFYNKLQMRHRASVFPLRTFLTRQQKPPVEGSVFPSTLPEPVTHSLELNPAPCEILSSWQSETDTLAMNVLITLFV